MNAPRMTLAEFLRGYGLRSPGIMWFFGAGTSASAGVPTAEHMIWEFKRLLYCTEQKRSLASCSDLGSPTLRRRLQEYFDAQRTHPPADSDEEYGHYFEIAHRTEGDRRRYLERHVAGASRSHGHHVLAALMQAGLVRLVWTVNFDRLPEDAAAEGFGTTGRLVVATLDTPQLAEDALLGDQWPLLVKLHGDFQSVRLKNTPREVQLQDERLRRCLVDGCRRFGLAVVGYSGRDHSVMDTLLEAAGRERCFPSGLFWFHRADAAPLPPVCRLIELAQRQGAEAALVEIETFDELFADIARLHPDFPSGALSRLEQRAPRVSNYPLPSVEGTWPILRLNALPIDEWPRTCRRVVADVGGIREVREAAECVSADAVFARRKIGLLAFGRDTEVRKILSDRRVQEFDLHTIEARRLRYESAELGLLYDALCRALARERPLFAERRGRQHVLVVDALRAASDRSVERLKTAAGVLGGVVPRTTLQWSEAIDLRIDYQLDRLWLLVVPTVWVQPITMPADSQEYAEVRETRMEFIRSRLAERYNRQTHQFLDAWAHIITVGAPRAQLRAFDIGDGVDAVFTISAKPGYSWRGRPS